MIFSWGVAMESEGKRAEWEARVMAWKASGLTQKEYCLREGIGFSGMRYWSARMHRAEKKLTLVPVQMSGSSMGVVIRGAGGWECVLPDGLSARWVAELLGAL